MSAGPRAQAIAPFRPSGAVVPYVGSPALVSLVCRSHSWFSRVKHPYVNSRSRRDLAGRTSPSGSTILHAGSPDPGRLATVGPVHLASARRIAVTSACEPMAATTRGLAVLGAAPHPRKVRGAAKRGAMVRREVTAALVEGGAGVGLEQLSRAPIRQPDGAAHADNRVPGRDPAADRRGPSGQPATGQRPPRRPARSSGAAATAAHPTVPASPVSRKSAATLAGRYRGTSALS
jgi:hypothetical protein